MNYYLLEFHTLPQLLFAHKHVTPSYSMHFDAVPTNRMEFTYMETGDIRFIGQSGDITICPAHSVYSCPHDAPFFGTSDGKPHTHHTFGIAGDFCASRLCASEALSHLNALLPNQTLLPELVLIEKTASRLQTIIDDIILANVAEKSQMQIASLVFSFLDLLYQEAQIRLLSNSGKSSYSDMRYCNQAIRIIAESVQEPLKVSDISEKLGVSLGHLSRIFKAYTGYSLVEYINKTKVETLKGILINMNLPNRELADAVGIYDEKYLCRIFKQYTGMTIRAYKKSLLLANKNLLPQS